MSNRTFKVNGTDFEDRYVQFEELGFDPPFVMQRQLWTWGIGGSGELGLNELTNYSSPVQVGSLTDWKEVSSGWNHNLAVKQDGTMWSWGFGGDGKLGHNIRFDPNDGVTSLNRSSPTQIGTDTNWKYVSTGGFHSMAIRVDGTLWGWGNSGNGEIGNSSRAARSSPVQVGSLSDWKSVAAGRDNVLAIKTDNSMWSWGRAQYGVLGLNDTLVSRSSPVQVGSLFDWKQVSLAAVGASAEFTRNASVVKLDGTLWAWGGGLEGQLGLNDLIYRSSPVQVGTLTNWKYVSVGIYGTAALKTDGTLWGWGGNINGNIGDGLRFNRSSPVQVGNLTNWVSVSTAKSTSAIKTDGTLWSWGRNNARLGNGATSARSSPIQIGSLQNWKQVSVGEDTARAIKFS